MSIIEKAAGRIDQQREAGTIEYNYRRGGHAMDKSNFPEPVKQFAATCGTDAPTYVQDRPGVSAFVLEDGAIYHTYSAYARGVESLTDSYRLLDTTPYGRQQDFEDSPPGWPQKPTYG